MVTQEVATPTFPDVKVISLCGSSDYTETFLEMQGNVVLAHVIFNYQKRISLMVITQRPRPLLILHTIEWNCHIVSLLGIHLPLTCSKVWLRYGQLSVLATKPEQTISKSLPP